MNTVENLLIASEELSNSLNDQQCEEAIINYIAEPTKQIIPVDNYLYSKSVIF